MGRGFHIALAAYARQQVKNLRYSRLKICATSHENPIAPAVFFDQTECMQAKRPMKTKGVFFDLYGTLLILGNMQQAWADWMGALFGAMGLRVPSLTKTAFDDCCHEFFRKEPPLLIEDGLTVFERRIGRLASTLGSTLEVPDLKKAATLAIDAWQAHIHLDPEALEVLAVLSQTSTLALISNFDHPPHAYRVLRETGLDAYFRTIVISGDVGIKKPAPGIFQIALDATGLLAQEVVYVGDTQEDVEGATAAGMRPILIARPADLSKPRMLDYVRKDHQPDQRDLQHRPSRIQSSESLTISSLREVITLMDIL